MHHAFTHAYTESPLLSPHTHKPRARGPATPRPAARARAPSLSGSSSSARTRRAADGVTAVECPMIRLIILPRWAAPRVVARPSLARTAFPFLVRRRFHFRRSRRARGGPAALFLLQDGEKPGRASTLSPAMPLPCHAGRAGRTGRPWGFPFRPPFASKRMHGSRAARRRNATN